MSLLNVDVNVDVNVDSKNVSFLINFLGFSLRLFLFIEEINKKYNMYIFLYLMF